MIVSHLEEVVAGVVDVDEQSCPLVERSETERYGVRVEERVVLRHLELQVALL